MHFEVDANKLTNLLTAEVVAALGFHYNIQNHMEAIEATEEEDYLVGLGKVIAYNKRNLNLHLQRAAILLQLVGEFDEDSDKLEVYAIEAKVAALKKRFGIKEGE